MNHNLKDRIKVRPTTAPVPDDLQLTGFHKAVQRFLTENSTKNIPE